MAAEAHVPSSAAGSAVPRPPSAPYVLDARRCSRERLERDEWLLPTGHGGFAMGTAAGSLGRQYHSLLNAASAPPVGRVATVSRVEEEIRAVQPGGSSAEALPLTLVSFEKTCTSASWCFECDGHQGVALRKTLQVGWRSNTAAVEYAIEAPEPVTLTLRPRVALRDFHHTLEELDPGRFVTTRHGEQGVSVEAEGHAVKIVCSTGTFAEDPDVSQHVDFATSRAREEKEKFGEPLWSPGKFTVACDAGKSLCVLALALAPEEPDVSLSARGGREEHLERVRAAAGAALGNADLAGRLWPLIAAADDFLVERRVRGESLLTVIAGYPWFADWGRDTMISLPGLMLSTGRLGEARSCLETFARFVSEGMVPNRFDDDDDEKAHYNTVDASLWYLQAVRAYVRASGDALGRGSVLLDACKQVVEGYERGTRFGIAVDPVDGLVRAGDAETQLTWMDALRDGVAFTPRYGKCVEINALWCSGLRAVAELFDAEDPEFSKELRMKADRAALAFNASFVRPDGRGLFDCLRPAGGAEGAWTPLAEIRPNQLFAVSLPGTPLAEEHMGCVLAVCKEHLLTPHGMRTLSPEDPNYKGRFKGGMMERDAAYHNGTVWPWLLGPYCVGLLRVGKFSEEARAEAGQAVATLLEDMSSGCLGQIAEVYDGDEPRAQEGCPAQAWSVAEVLRVLTLLAQ